MYSSKHSRVKSQDRREQVKQCCSKQSPICDTVLANLADWGFWGKVHTAHSVFQIQLLYSMNRGSEGARQNAQISFIFEISRCAAAKRLKSFEPDGIIASVLFASEPSESSSFASKCWDLANCITARPSSSLCSLFFYRSVHLNHTSAGKFEGSKNRARIYKVKA